MNRPPLELDGAHVLCWVASHRGGFYQLGGSSEMVAAMVIARYGDSRSVYLFKCNSNWEVIQDWDYDSVADAKAAAAQLANGETLLWQSIA